MSSTATDWWQHLLDNTLRGGNHVTARQQDTIEILGARSKIDMRTPIVSSHVRNTPGYLRFMAAEAYWILSGSGRLDEIRYAAESFDQFSDGGLYMQGAYGPRFIEQLQYIAECFASDIHTRQAVVEIWRPMPRPSKDVPCTLSLQWLFRNDNLHCVASMRSSDLWLGFPFDVFSFSMMSAYVLLTLQSKNILPKKSNLGMLTLTAGSQHIYKRNLAKVEAAINNQGNWDYLPMNIHEFNTPDCLLTHLSHIAKCRWTKISHKFMSETIELRK